MTKHLRTVEQIRIEIPLRLAHVYWFVEQLHSEWDPWWGEFFEFLLAFGVNELEWGISPTGDSAIARPELTRSQCADIVRFIRSAPESQIATHRTLNRAVAMTQAQEEGLGLVFFSSDISGLNH